MARHTHTEQDATRCTKLLTTAKRSLMNAAKVVAQTSGDMGHVGCLLMAIDRIDRVIVEQEQDRHAKWEPRRSSAKPKKSRRHEASAPLDMDVLPEEEGDVHPQAS